MEFPGKRAPTVASAAIPGGTYPSDPMRGAGPPVPYGTPVTDRRMALPQNKYPYIPPEADYDPGPPVVNLPPGVPPGPGPALTPPYPLPVPPNTPGPQPFPLPFQAPPDQYLPPYGQRPPPPALPAVGTSTPGPLPAEAAPAAPSAAYDEKSGAFLDPNGGIGVYAAGASHFTPPRTGWISCSIHGRHRPGPLRSAVMIDQVGDRLLRLARTDREASANISAIIIATGVVHSSMPNATAWLAVTERSSR